MLSWSMKVQHRPSCRRFPRHHLNFPPPPPTNRALSNRYAVRIEIAVTHTKQTTVILSNRNKKPPPGGGAFQLSRRNSGEYRRRNFLRQPSPTWAARVKWPPRRWNL